MLLNEFLKEHHKVVKLEVAVASLAAALKEQALLLQKVSADIGTSSAAAKVGSRNP